MVCDDVKLYCVILSALSTILSTLIDMNGAVKLYD